MILAVVLQTSILTTEHPFATMNTTWKPDLVMEQAYVSMEIASPINTSEFGRTICDMACHDFYDSSWRNADFSRSGRRITVYATWDSQVVAGRATAENVSTIGKKGPDFTYLRTSTDSSRGLVITMSEGMLVSVRG